MQNVSVFKVVDEYGDAWCLVLASDWVRLCETAAKDALRQVPSSRATAKLRRWFDSERCTVARLRALAQALGLRVGGASLGKRAIAARLQRQLRDGGVAMFVRVRSDERRSAGLALSQQHDDALAARPMREESRDWIEIELIDHAGAAVGGERYELTTPSGELLNGTLDGDGCALVALESSGVCIVKFPGLTPPVEFAQNAAQRVHGR